MLGARPTTMRTAAVLAVVAACAGTAACGGEEAAGPETVTVTREAEPADTVPTTLDPLDEEPPPQDDRTLPERPADFPNGGEAFVLARLSPGIDAERCTREPADARSDGAIAGVYCDLEQTDGVLAYYDLFRDAGTALDAYDAIRRSRDLAADSGGCRPEHAEGEGPWSWSVSGEEGRVACFRREGRSWYVWVQPAMRAVGFASADGPAAADAFWNADGLLRERTDADLPATGAGPTPG